jgi:hypothetical protein
MSDDPLDRLPNFDRVSIPAVLVHEGEDPGPALQEAGIVDAIAVPVIFDDDPYSPDGFFGDGITDNLPAVLEQAEVENDEDPAYASHAERGHQQPDAITSRAATVARPPAAFGSRPLAPIRRKS